MEVSKVIRPTKLWASN